MTAATQTKKIPLLTATAFAIGAMIGGGVFVLSGVALKQAGPAAIVSFIVAGCMVLLSALSFAVISGQAPTGTTGYAYVGQVLGSSRWSFLTSWCFYLGGVIGAAFVLNAFGVYAHEFIASSLPTLGWALLAALLLTLVNLGAASAIGRVENFLVVGKLLILVMLIVFGALHFHASYMQPFSPHGSLQIFATSAFLFIAFLGFNVITNMSSDIDRPARTIPRAILLSMLVVTLVYVGVIMALLAGQVSSYSEASVGVAARHLIGPVGGTLVVIGALVSTLSSANANILGSSELMVRMAYQKEVPTILGHLRHGHPYLSVLTGAVLYTALLLTGKTQVIINLANVVSILALIIVNLAAVRLLRPNSGARLRLPLGWLLPVLGIAGAALQFFFIPLSSDVIGGALAASGLLIYLLRHRFHSPRLHREVVRIIADMEGPLARAIKR